MAQARINSVFALILIFNVAPILGEIITVEVGDSVNFTATCTDREFKLTTRDNTRVVAKLSNGVWTPGADYRDRLQHHSASCVGLTRVNYNDDGLYELFCGGSAVALIHLEVVRVSEVPLTEGDPGRLRCDSFTAASSAKPVRWEKDGELVFELDPSSKKTNGTGFDGRLNVSEPDWHLKGDVSVTLDRVKPEDRGVYLCYGQDKEGKRKLVAWRVTVKERNPDETTCPPPPACPTQKETGTGTIVAITAPVTVFVTTCLLAAALRFVRWLKHRRTNVPL